MKAPDRQHPGEDQLIALYFGAADSAAEEQRLVRQHVHGCETCTWRYAELVAPLERLRADAASEADEIFTPARLDAQRAAIRERLEQGVRASRVIPFPASQVRLDRVTTARPMFRWVAAAAAAGLLVGVSAGRFIGLNHPPVPAPARSASVATPARTAPPAPAVAYQSDQSEEALLSEVESALTRHRIAALSALDDLTPHAREAVLARR